MRALIPATLAAAFAIGAAVPSEKPAVEPPADEATVELCRQAVTRFTKADPSMFDVFQKQTANASVEHGIAAEGEKLPLAFKRLQAAGQPLALEFVGRKMIGESFLSVMFLCKYQEGPICWKFTFYRPKQQWLLYDFRYGPDLAILLQ